MFTYTHINRHNYWAPILKLLCSMTPGGTQLCSSSQRLPVARSLSQPTCSISISKRLRRGGWKLSQGSRKNSLYTFASCLVRSPVFPPPPPQHCRTRAPAIIHIIQAQTYLTSHSKEWPNALSHPWKNMGSTLKTEPTTASYFFDARLVPTEVLQVKLHIFVSNGKQTSASAMQMCEKFFSVIEGISSKT